MGFGRGALLWLLGIPLPISSRWPVLALRPYFASSRRMVAAFRGACAS